MTETVAEILAAYRAGAATPADMVARSYARISARDDPAIFIALRQEAENVRKYSHDQRDDYAWAVRDALERQLPNTKWLVREHCDLGATLAVVETRVRELCEPDGCPDTNYDGHRTLAFLDTLAALRRPH